MICDECATAAYDEGASEFHIQLAICLAHGDDIGDHNCEKKDNEDVDCQCRCNNG